MTFIQFNFLIFLILATIFFYICPVKVRWVSLLIISIVFYAIAGVKYLPFIFVTTFTIYLAGLKMGAIYKQQDEELKAEGVDKAAKKQIKEQAKKRCRRIVAVVLIFNIAILCVVKFTKFFIEPINSLLQSMGGQGNFKAEYIIVPLGISYYTFSTISYLLDVYWKRVEYEKNYFRFLLYAIYFPHILQGPIERYGKLGQRLKKELRFDYDRVCSGIQLMLYGFFKKLVIADRINIFIDGVYGDYVNQEGFVLILAMLLDVVYIYADFSGCMDIARGVSDIFGVELDLNFDHPFASKSIVEFWRRWHMSLGSWFKDYVYYSVSTSGLVKGLSKKTKDKWPPRLSRALITIIPVFATWLLTGLWHGTGITYVSWGIYYSIMIFISVTFEEDFQKLGKLMHINAETEAWRIVQSIRTTLIFAGGRLLTRPGTLQASWGILKRAFSKFNPWVFFNDGLYKYGLDRQNFALAFICIIIFGIISSVQQKESVRGIIARQNLLVRWLIYILGFMSIVVLGVYGEGYDAAAFVYMAY